MSLERVALRQGSQHRIAGCSIGFISTTIGAGGLRARVGIAGAEGRSSHLLAEGERVPLPGAGGVTLRAISVSPDGSECAISLEIDAGAK